MDSRRKKTYPYRMSTSHGSNPISAEQLLNQLNWRYATKQFDPTRKLTDATWKTLEAALILSPSSFGLQPWRFYVVTDQAMKTKLREFSWNQPQVTDCSHQVAFAVHPKITAADVDEYVDSILATRHMPREAIEGYRQVMIGFVSNPKIDMKQWATKQAYIALGQLMASAALLGVDACPMEGISAPDYDKLLGIANDGYETTVACAVGYRSPGDKYATAAKVRYPASKVVKHI